MREFCLVWWQQVLILSLKRFMTLYRAARGMWKIAVTKQNVCTTNLATAL